MNVTDVSPVRVDQPGYATALESLFLLVALFSFLRVAAYTARQSRQGTLINSPRSPVPFPVEPLLGWIFVAAVLLMIFGQNPLYFVVVLGGVGGLLAVSQRSADYQFGLSRLGSLHLLRWAVVICGAVFFLELPLSHVVDRFMNWLRVPHPVQQAVLTFQQYDRPGEILVFIFNAAVIVPVIEELFFRGFLFSFLKRFTSTWAAIVLSAGVFAFAHVNLGSVLQLWLLGIVLATAYEHTGSLLLPVGIHGCFNLVTALSLLVEKGLS